MSRAFTKIAFTAAVKGMQRREGTRARYEGAGEATSGRPDNITAALAAWLQRAESFFISTVGSDGWPYVQHRGGEPGMITINDDKTFQFDDVAGNGQMITVGNLQENDRVMFIFMDYQYARRVKLWGRAKVIDLHPEETDYRRRVRTIVVTLEAYNFNCSAFIPHYLPA